MSLLYATLITASQRWRGVPMTPAMVRHLQNLRTETDALAAKEAIARRCEDFYALVSRFRLISRITG